MVLVCAALAGLGRLLAPPMAYADDTDTFLVSGPVRLIDNDRFVVADKIIRLYGIDVPDEDQSCTLGGTPWACGEAARDFLDSVVAKGPFVCHGRADNNLRRRGKFYAICMQGDETVNDVIVRSGFAVALREQSTLYVAAEDAAHAAKAGLWQSEFLFPQKWRDELKFGD